MMPDPTGELTPYSELADLLGHLPLLLREARRQRRLSVRAAATQLGMSFSTVSRIESGDDCVLSNAVAVLRWLGPWEPATEQPEPVKILSYYYGPTAADPDRGAMWCYGCGGRVDLFGGHAICSCGAQLCESPADCGNDACPYRPAEPVREGEALGVTDEQRGGDHG